MGDYVVFLVFLSFNIQTNVCLPTLVGFSPLTILSLLDMLANLGLSTWFEKVIQLVPSIFFESGTFNHMRAVQDFHE
ncbi:hypothetical protein BCR33DRAFT_158045 [Rhizoclosmatium globosum]|uniref:Uncharacterized protein n=1 Tax=Rhizoclosmatium globosum TaxID=329046 RepID=A0A1Y2CG41_9FUNG|nr:hypothetical protein BCR33DRAFT_158045 [Rhizoclosmatium globosum]|eukprot:ORY46010.1 hypothetical protein BCR33DRAFT_158045 [Rhizoclosmatium globosum]